MSYGGIEETDRLNLQITGADKVRDLTKALREEKDALDDANDAAKEGGQSLASLEGVFTSLTTNGIKGTVSGLAGLAKAIGPTGWAIVGAQAAAVAFDWLGPSIANAFSEWTKGSNKIPESTDAFDRLSTALKTARDDLNAMAKGWRGSAEEVAKYNELTATTARLEREVNDEKERRGRIDAIKREAEQSGREGGDIARQAIQNAGGADAVVQQVVQARGVDPTAARGIIAQIAKVEGQQDTLYRQGNAAGAANLGPVIEGLRRKLKQAEDEAQRKAVAGAQDLVGMAGQGDQAAIGELARVLPGRDFDQATHAGIAAQNAEVEAVDAEGARLRRAGARRRANRKELEATEREERILQGQRQNQAAKLEQANKGVAARDARDAEQARDAVDRIFAPIDAAERREEWDRQQEEQERFSGGGFSGKETATIAKGNLLLAKGDRGEARPADVDRAIADAEAALAEQVEGGFDPRVMGVLSQLTAELRQLKGSLNQQAQMQKGAMGGPMMGQFSPAPVYQSPFGF